MSMGKKRAMIRRVKLRKLGLLGADKEKTTDCDADRQDRIVGWRRSLQCQ